MYDWEIDQLLKIKNYIISSEDYINILNTSPQIKRVKYNPYEDNFEMWTKEESKQSNYYKYKVKIKTPK